MVDTLKIILDPSGDRETEMSLIDFSLQQQRIFRNLMTFNDLKQDRRKVFMTDGSIIDIRSCFGEDVVRIYSPPIVSEERKPESTEYLVVSAYNLFSGKTSCFVWDIALNDYAANVVDDNKNPIVFGETGVYAIDETLLDGWKGKYFGRYWLNNAPFRYGGAIKEAYPATVDWRKYVTPGMFASYDLWIDKGIEYSLSSDIYSIESCNLWDMVTGVTGNSITVKPKDKSPIVTYKGKSYTTYYPDTFTEYYSAHDCYNSVCVSSCINLFFPEKYVSDGNYVGGYDAFLYETLFYNDSKFLEPYQLWGKSLWWRPDHSSWSCPPDWSKESFPIFSYCTGIRNGSDSGDKPCDSLPLTTGLPVSHVEYEMGEQYLSSKMPPASTPWTINISLLVGTEVTQTHHYTVQKLFSSINVTLLPNNCFYDALFNAQNRYDVSFDRYTTGNAGNPYIKNGFPGFIGAITVQNEGDIGTVSQALAQGLISPPVIHPAGCALNYNFSTNQSGNLTMEKVYSGFNNPLVDDQFSTTYGSHAVQGGYNGTYYPLISSSTTMSSDKDVTEIALMTQKSVIQIYSYDDYAKDTFCQCKYYASGVWGRNLLADKKRSSKLENAVIKLIDFSLAQGIKTNFSQRTVRLYADTYISPGDSS